MRPRRATSRPISCGVGLSLRWSDIDFTRAAIFVRSTSSKTRESRSVPIQPNLAAFLVRPGPRSGKVFPVNVQSAIQTWWKQNRGGRLHWPHDIGRHSYISYQLARTGNIAQVAEWAGNSPIIIRKHDRRPLLKEEGEAWFKILPPGMDEGEIVAMRAV
jgi:integrase